MTLSDAALAAKLARLTPAELAELDGLLLSQPPAFRDWLPQVTPSFRWDWPHLRHIQDHLEALDRGDIENLMVLCPPRHGKTEMNTVRYPVYRLQHDPAQRIILAAYNATLARKFSRKARRIARQVGIRINEERTAVEDWETLAGGGVRAVGVGEGVTGQGSNLTVIDDPIKSREEAESQVYRDKTWDWLMDDVYTRSEPGGQKLFTYTPWHEDDTGQRLLNSEEGKRWTVVRLPALAEPDDPLGRWEGAALCPDRYNEEALQRLRTALGEYTFSALFQCRPTPRSGNMFPADRVQIVDAVPPQMRWVRYWDFAGTRDGGAYTAGVKMASAHGVFYVLDVVRVQKAASERDALVRLTAELDGHHGVQWLEQEPGSAGKDGKANFLRLMAGFSAYAEPASGDKVVRAEDSGWAAQWQAGNVRLLRGDWNKPYIAEHGSFPSGKFKDQVDASVGAFTKLAKRPSLPMPLADLTKESHWHI